MKQIRLIPCGKLCQNFRSDWLHENRISQFKIHQRCTRCFIRTSNFISNWLCSNEQGSGATAMKHHFLFTTCVSMISRTLCATRRVKSKLSQPKSYEDQADRPHEEPLCSGLKFLTNKTAARRNTRDSAKIVRFHWVLSPKRPAALNFSDDTIHFVSLEFNVFSWSKVRETEHSVFKCGS